MLTAIYARYSDDNKQDETSIEDQFRICRIRANKEGWEVYDEYADYGESGAVFLRADFQRLLQDAMAGKFKQVLMEDLDRLTRDLEDIAGFYKRMEFAGVQIFSLADGVITDLHVGMKGTMSARFLKDLANKTHRGLRGRVEKGKSGGGKSYGYKVIHKVNPDGEIEVGDREINEEQAEIVRRIYAEYLLGRSPKKIAFKLNEDGIPGPSGKTWGPSTIYGNRERGTGILNNELYIGRLVWNKMRYVRNPDTRKRVSRLNPESEWVIHEVPHLRIIDQNTWEKVKVKQGEYNKKSGALWQRNRPPKLLSYLIKCGVCGGGCSMVSQTHYGCSTARNKGTCDNRRTIKREKLEETVISALQTHLLDKELCAEFCREYTDHLNTIRQQHNKARNNYVHELEKLKRENDKLVDAILRGVPPETLKEKGEYIVRRKAEITKILDESEEAPVLFHPNMANRYHDEVLKLVKALDNEEHREEAASLIRNLVEKIVLTPNEDNTGLTVDLVGDLAGILSVATKGDRKLVQSGLSYLNQSRQTDSDEKSDSVNKDEMVAGVRNDKNLISEKPSHNKEALVVYALHRNKCSK